MITLKNPQPVREAFRVSGRSDTHTPRREPRNGPVVVTRVHPLVWRAALHAASGEIQRIERVSDFEVIVHNGGGGSR